VIRWPISLAFLTLRPTWRAREISFEARTPLVLRALSLFGYDRRLRIDSNRRIVLLQTRRYWFQRHTRIIPFERIKSIVYGYSPLPFADDGALDVFRIGLSLTDEPDPVSLFEFRADAGLAANIALDVGEELSIELPIEFETDEELASETFIQLLKRYLGKPVRSAIHSRVLEAIRKELYPCPHCGRKIMRVAVKCIYCGNRLS
jgi:hypothetical protein